MKFKDYKLTQWVNKNVTKQLEISGISILLLEVDWTLIPPESGRRNLIAIDKNEDILWIADLPKAPFVSYHNVEIIDEKIQGTAGSFVCEIDKSTGKILKDIFIK